MTNDEDVFDYINNVKSQGQTKDRMTNIQAALLYGQLETLSDIKEKKHAIFSLYRELFKDVEGISLQEIEPNTEHAEWMFGLRFNSFSVSQKMEMELHLYQSGIDTRKFFYPISMQKHISTFKNTEQNSLLLHHQCILIPSFPNLTLSQVEYIANSIKNYLH